MTKEDTGDVELIPAKDKQKERKEDDLASSYQTVSCVKSALRLCVCEKFWSAGVSLVGVLACLIRLKCRGPWQFSANVRVLRCSCHPHKMSLSQSRPNKHSEKNTWSAQFPKPKFLLATNRSALAMI